MGKATAKRHKAKNVPLEKLDTPTTAQLANHTYTRQFVTHVDSNTKAMAFISDHDPVERWQRAKRMSDSQMVSIGAVRRLWGILGHMPKVTANYGERIPGHGNAERSAINEIEAREDLTRIQGYFPAAYWNVFENVCRWGMPAGVVGGELGYGSRSAQDRAHQIVVTLADMIFLFERY